MLQRSPSPAPVRVLVIGHSHIFAICRAYEDSTRKRDTSAPASGIRFVSLAPNAMPWPVRRLAKWPVAYWTLVRWRVWQAVRQTKPDLVVSCIGGNDHAIFGLVNHPTRYDFVLPERPGLELDRSAELLPSAIVTAWLRKRMKDVRKAIIGLRAQVSVPMVHLESPPPVPSAHIEQFPGRFAEEIATNGVAAEALRYKLWRVQSALMKQICEQRNILFMPAPPMTQDRAGMLARWACGRDPTHGNLEYGRHVLDDLTVLIERSQIKSQQAPQASQ